MAKLIPVWEIVERTFAEKGIKMSPKLVLAICDKIAKEINQPKESVSKKEVRCSHCNDSD